MHAVTSRERLEAIVGTPRPMVMLKQVDALDEGCLAVLERSPIAGFGFRDAAGVARTTFTGGAPGFARIESPKRISLAHQGHTPVAGGGVSLVFMLPGIGETLRLNGAVVEHAGGRVVIEVAEIYVHCARCVLRSGLWSAAPVPAEPTDLAGFFAASPFAVVSTWNADGASDTSPRGDPPGFIRMLDARTLALPDRRGNQRADTLHNLLSCDQVALAAVIPGRDEVLHVSGTGFMTDDAPLLATMALADKPPHAALVIRVEHSELSRNAAVTAADLWRARVDPTAVPDLIHLAAQHLASNKAVGVKAALTRALVKGLAVAPGLARRAIDFGYRSQLDDEGYAAKQPK